MPITDSVLIFIPILVLIGLLETVLSAMWVPFYMRLGIPIWWQSSPLATKEQFWQAAEQLDGTELSGTWYPTIIFKRLSPNELAFRHKFWELKVGFRFRSPVRGLVRLVDGEYSVKVINYLPWSMPAVLVLFLWLFSSFNRPEFENGSGLGFFIFLLLVVALTFGLQLVIFRQIDNRILEQIVGKHY